MKLAVLTAPERFEIVEAPVPEVADDEVLVRVSACGVCASELDIWSGAADVSYPLYPGHEVSGTVVDRGAKVTAYAPGDPVAVWRAWSEHEPAHAVEGLLAGLG